jgi:hypothetical protein
MVLAVQVFQPLSRNMRIDLRRREITVSQQQLYDPEIGTTIQKVRRKSVAEAVWR